MSDNEDDDSVDPLELLAKEGFVGGEAVDALMQAGGDVDKAVLLLRSENSSSKTTSKKAKKSKKKRDNNKNNSKGGGGSTTPTEGPAKPKAPMGFKEQRKEELRAKKAARDSKRVCRVCGGPHLRKECPGIMDDGRGHSRYHAAKGSRRENDKQRKEFHQQREHDQAHLEIGHWTRGGQPYIDGFANLMAAFNQYEEQHNQEQGDETSQTKKLDLTKWFKDWATLQVSLGPETAKQTPEQRKADLKKWAGSKLRQRASSFLTGDDKERIDAALAHPNPRSELINIILEAEEEQKSAATSLDLARSLNKEWPGFHGCITPLSVLLKGGVSKEVLTALNDKEGASSSSVKVLLSVPPEETAQCMAVSMEDGDSSSFPIDVLYLQRTLSSGESKDNESYEDDKTGTAEANVAKFRKALKLKHSRLFDTKEMSEEVAKIATLDSSRITSLLQQHLDGFDGFDGSTGSSNRDNGVVVGISCGLNYETPAAKHKLFGSVVRQAQRDACTIAVQMAVKCNTPIVLQCQDAKTESGSTGIESSSSSASKDLVRILAVNAPEETKMLLRNGSLTVAPEPGLNRLLQTWRNLHLGVDAKIAFSKCPKELLDVVFDLSMDRLVLTSEAPASLPPSLTERPHLTPICLPPHVACTADTVSKVKGGSISREDVLQQSTENLRTLFGWTSDP